MATANADEDKAEEEEEEEEEVGSIDSADAASFLKAIAGPNVGTPVEPTV